MLSIGNKKYRNLQEQVGYNTECIKKIDEYLDGIAVSDKLVVIDSDSGTFTNEELAIIGGPLAFISNGSKVWVKEDETSGEFIFKAVDIKANTTGEPYFNIGGSKIVINKGTGDYNVSTDTIIVTYSKSQVDSFIENLASLKADKAELALKANIAGQDFTGAVTAPTLHQTQANLSQSFNFTAISSDVSVTNIYNRCEVINNILYLIANIKLKNVSGGSLQVGGGWGRSPFISFLLPSSLAMKIVDIDNVPAGQVAVAGKIICSVPAICLSGTIGSASTKAYNGWRLDFTNREGVNEVAAYFNTDQSITLEKDEEVTFMARLSLTLI